MTHSSCYGRWILISSWNSFAASRQPVDSHTLNVVSVLRSPSEQLTGNISAEREDNFETVLRPGSNMTQDDVSTVVKYILSKGKKPGESLTNTDVSAVRWFEWNPSALAQLVLGTKARRRHRLRLQTVKLRRSDHQVRSFGDENTTDNVKVKSELQPPG